MSSEKQDRISWVKSGLRTGAVGLLVLLALLLSAAFLISLGKIPEGNEKYIIPISMLISGFLSRKLTNVGRGGALPKALFSTSALMLCLTLLSAAVKDIHLNLMALGISLAVYALGDLLGSVVKINKKHRRKHNQRRTYNR